ncbi:MAG: hemolysin family protein [Bacillaceae bacterium]
MDDSILLKLFVLLILIGINAFFAASEIAIISLNDQKIKRMAEEGNKRAKLIVALIKEPSKFLATIQVGVTLSGFLASAFAAESFAKRITAWAVETNLPISESVIQTCSLIIVTIILSYVTLVFGELVPKRIGMQKAEVISLFVARPLTIIGGITRPFVKMLSLSTNGVIRLLGKDPNESEETVTEEEIRMMVDVGEESGVIQHTEKTMISNVLEFNDKTVGEVMTHRTDIVAFSISDSIEEILSLVVREQYTRIPAYEESIDNIIGILHAKDLLPYLVSHQIKQIDIQKLLRKPHYILEATKTSDAFAKLQQGTTYLAVVVDEYGGTAGIITMEDLVEEIVGNIRDEYDESEEQEMIQLDENTFIVQGIYPIVKLKHLLNLSIDEEDYDTIGGYVMGQIGRIIKKGEKPKIQIENCTFEVIEASENRISKLKITKITN